MRKAFLAAAALSCGCVGQSASQKVGGPPPKEVPFENMTLQNILRWPSTTEYIEGLGVGRPPEGETDQGLRRRASRDQAAIDAQRRLIEQLQDIVPRDRVQDFLRQAEVAKLEFGYDDACTLVLRIPKEAVVGKPPIE